MASIYTSLRLELNHLHHSQRWVTPVPRVIGTVLSASRPPWLRYPVSPQRTIGASMEILTRLIPFECRTWGAMAIRSRTRRRVHAIIWRIGLIRVISAFYAQRIARCRAAHRIGWSVMLKWESRDCRGMRVLKGCSDGVSSIPGFWSWHLSVTIVWLHCKIWYVYYLLSCTTIEPYTDGTLVLWVSCRSVL